MIDNLDGTPQPTNQAPAMGGAVDAGKLIPRAAPEPTQERSALVKQITASIKRDKAKWQQYFDLMAEDQAFAYGLQYPGQLTLKGEERYIANIVQRHIKTLVAKLYAKNPKVVARRRERLDFAVWDETPEAMKTAIETLQTATQLMQDPNAVQMGIAQQAMQATQAATALIKDVSDGVQQRKMLDKVGKTLEILMHDGMTSQTPDLKLMMKQLVRRTACNGVGYLKLGYQRVMTPRPDRETQLSDVTNKLANLERLRADLADGESDPHSAEAEELRLMQTAIQAEPDMLVREGLVFDFPLSNRVIPDARMRYVGVEGFIGAGHVSEEFMLTPDQIKEIYRVDIGNAYMAYTQTGVSTEGKSVFSGEVTLAKQQNLCAVWEHYDPKSGLVYTLCDGYGDFLKDPAPPNVKTPQFHPFFPLVFNQLEDIEHAFPPSDVRLLRSIQREHNRTREALRQHRIANRPLYVASASAFGEKEDVLSMADHDAHEILLLQGLKEGGDIGKLVQLMQKAGIDPNVYDTKALYDDAQRVVGSQASDMGTTSGATATEVGNAETQRMSSIGSNIDDLDAMLTLVARSSSQVLLIETSPETVAKVVGPGAAWPQFTAQDIATEIWLEVEAGSSGRPNQAQEIANFERLYPMLIQTPGINPIWLGKYAIKIMDDRLNITDAILEGLPSIVAMNGMAQVSTGQPITDPTAQGGQGGNNAAKPGGPGPQPGPQPGNPVAGAPPGNPATAPRAAAAA